MLGHIIKVTFKFSCALRMWKPSYWPKEQVENGTRKSRGLSLIDVEPQIGSKLGKEYIKSVYCHLAYLTYIKSISQEMLDWKKHKLESRLPGEILIASDMQMTSPFWQKEKRN